MIGIQFLLLQRKNNGRNFLQFFIKKDLKVSNDFSLSGYMRNKMKNVYIFSTKEVTDMIILSLLFMSITRTIISLHRDNYFLSYGTNSQMSCGPTYWPHQMAPHQKYFFSSELLFIFEKYI